MPEHPLDPIFHPRAVAVVGVSSRPRDAGGGGGWDGGFFQTLRAAGFAERGGLYPVNPKADEIDGVRCYPTLLDCPDPVDHVISQVPARAVSGLADQCIEKGIRSLHLFTAGFSETGDPEMAEVEREVIERLRAAGIRTIGPNCMGLHVPASRLTFVGGAHTEPGSVFLLSQSGVNAEELVSVLSPRGVAFSKAISYGNGADLQAHDFLDYAAWDPQTEVVAAYVEGVADGRAFFEALKRCARQKPVIVLKGGLTGSGSRAARSHTGSLAGSRDVFAAACRQAGALRVETLEELHDMIVALSTNARRIAGRGVALVAGGGGGFAVLSSDAVDARGLSVPPMPPDAVERLHEFIPVAGSSVNNPLDAMAPPGREDDLLRIVATASGIDMVFTGHFGRSRWGDSGDDDAGDQTDDQRRERIETAAAESARRMRALQDETGVPFIGIARGNQLAGTLDADTGAFDRAARRAGIATFASVPRAAHAIGQIQQWRTQREGLPEVL